ncbi:MAG: zinc ribbon domain-containing protein [Nocardioidaceae bacterium]
MDESPGPALDGPEEPALKADPFALLTLLDVQAVDSALAQLAHRRRTLPELAELQRLADLSAGLDERRITLETMVSDLTRDSKRADVEVEQVKARRARNSQRLDTGAVSSPRELEQLQHELVALDRRISTLEDQELEVLQQLENATGELQRVREQLTEVRAEIDQLSELRDAALQELTSAGVEHQEERARLVEILPDPLLTAYEKVRAHNGGVGAAALRGRRCDGCQLELTSVDLAEAVKAPPDEVLRCPECNRILVRTARPVA